MASIRLAIKALPNLTILAIVSDGEMDPPTDVALAEGSRGQVEFSRSAQVLDPEIDLSLRAHLSVSMAVIESIGEKDGAGLARSNVASPSQHSCRAALRFRARRNWTRAFRF